MALQRTFGLIVVSTLFVGCQNDATSAATEPPESPAQSASEQAEPAPPTRHEFSGGSFVTYNKALPAEVIEAASGRAPARPVVVWAGYEAPSPKLGK
jgi:hypothetical protein